MPRGLEDGLMSVIPTEMVELRYDPSAKKNRSGQRVGEEIIQIDADKIDPNPQQPRQSFDQRQLDALSDSIKIHGILQPLVLTKSGSRYQLIAGERRLRASKQIALTTVPAIVRSFDEQQKLELALIENLQREELNPIETATAYRKLADQFNLSLPEIARRIGRDRSTINNSLRLLELPDQVKAAVAGGKLSEGHARVILMVGDSTKQLEAMALTLKHSWTVRQIEEFARGLKQAKGDAAGGLKRIAGFKGEDEISKKLSRLIGHKVKTVPTAAGGRLVIHFQTEEELRKLGEAIEKGWQR